MIVLENEKEIIKKFIADSVEAFKADNEKFTSIGIYGCPWAGWMSLNFNIQKSLPDADFNCPDFDVVEYELLELEGWENEYEGENPEYMLEGKITVLDFDSGNEVLNGLFFKFLSSIVLEIKHNYKQEILLQMLDSLCKGVF